MTAAPVSPPQRGRAAELVVAVLTSVVAAGIAGAAAGFVWGGIGGRIAMRILFLTSSDLVDGMTSDDGFEIGRVSADTLALVIGMTIVGGVLGSFYGFARHVFDGSAPASRAGIVAAIGLFAGAAIVHTDGVDFRFLEPLWLSVGLFVALPALWAATLIPLTERLVAAAAQTGVPRTDDRPLGRIGLVAAWGIITVMILVGLVDLISDYRDLSER